jgi:hypothetical protein
VYLEIPENPNCDALDGQVFQCRSAARVVTHVRCNRAGMETWCEVTGFNLDGRVSLAMACEIDDSGDGTCYLVSGGTWGLRLKDSAASQPWSLEDSDQWGEPFLLVPADGQSVRFA